MIKNREIPRLDDLAFEALLRHRNEITPNSEAEYEVLMRHKFKREISSFLQAIADGNQAEVEEMLNDNPQLVAVACGTVITPSLDTIENVTAVQLSYILEDEKICKVLADAVDRLAVNKNDPKIKEKVSRELAIKVAEVKEQEIQFTKFDFTDLVKAITQDKNLVDTGIASSETEKAFAQFKEYFKPNIVTKGRPFNMQDLQHAYEIYDKNFEPWDAEQLVWFLHNVVRLLLGRVAASYGQAFSNGLTSLFSRSFKLSSFRLANIIGSNELFYYSACHSSSVDNKFFVDINYGACAIWPARPCGVRSKVLRTKLQNLREEKAAALEEFKQRLAPQEHQIERHQIQEHQAQSVLVSKK